MKSRRKRKVRCFDNVNHYSWKLAVSQKKYSHVYWKTEQSVLYYILCSERIESKPTPSLYFNPTRHISLSLWSIKSRPSRRIFLKLSRVFHIMWFVEFYLKGFAITHIHLQCKLLIQLPSFEELELNTAVVQFIRVTGQMTWLSLLQIDILLFL